MISNLWHAPTEATALGTATTGSSEAIMLGGLALKRRWQAKMKAAGKNIHEPVSSSYRPLRLVADWFWDANSSKRVSARAQTSSWQVSPRLPSRSLPGILRLSADWSRSTKRLVPFLHFSSPHCFWPFTNIVSPCQSNYVMSAENMMKYVDENTIGVFV